MKRDIIIIDEEKCNGCGKCIPGCPEGALQIIDEKARLISDLFCDGLGACIGDCPKGAISIENREAVPYDEEKTMENIIKGGKNVIKAHLEHLKAHGETKYLEQALNFLEKQNLPTPDYKETTACNCPSTMAKKIERTSSNDETVNLTPQLNNWPIQLGLMNPNASYFDDAELVIAADCVPFSYPNFHQKFLKGKILIMFCPKLDTTLNEYVEKLTEIFRNKNIQSVSIIHMEVPCCSGIEIIVKKALETANKTMMVKDYTISISGEVLCT